MYDVRTMLKNFENGLAQATKNNEAHVQSFMHLLGTTYNPGALDTKTKELISVAIGVYNRCEYCIVFHTYKAFEHGATRQEIIEAAMVSVAFGGSPTIAYVVTLLHECLDEFENDF